MTRCWAVNASPIITLNKIGRVNLLSQLCDDLVIPQGVADEIQNGGYNDPAVIWIQTEGAKYVQPMESIDPRIASWDLGMGESYVMSWLIENPGFEAIIDDRAARKAAAILGLPVRGTVSVIAIAKRNGYLASAQNEYEKLIDAGFRISADILSKALKLADE